MKSNEIIRDAMENKGYSQFDFIGYEYVSEPVITENRCIVRNVDRIDYPIDKVEIVRFFEEHAPSFLIVFLLSRQCCGFALFHSFQLLFQTFSPFFLAFGKPLDSQAVGRRPFLAMQKAVFYTLKGGLLHGD